MSKRRFINSDDDLDMLNPNSKRIRNCDGSSSSVNPSRYDPNFAETRDTDEEDEMKIKDPNNMDMEEGLDMESLANGPSFDTLLYKLASMNVTEEKELVETCPICFARVSLKQFPSHVYSCLDEMDEGDRNDLQGQVERDQNMAWSLVEHQPYSYSEDMTWNCPICNKQLSVGQSINVHANECLDAQEEDETSSAMGKFSIQSNSMQDDQMDENNSNPSNAPKQMTTQQMSACATALLSNPKGSQEYDSMLNMFETLGFNEKSIRRVVEGKEVGKEGGDAEMSGNDPPPPSPFDAQQSAMTSFNPGTFSNPVRMRPNGLEDIAEISDSDI